MVMRTCVRCSHWDSLSADADEDVGLCRRYALAPSFDAWPITEARDGCDSWTGGHLFVGDDGVIQQERRTTVRSRCDCPAQLQLPSGDRDGQLTNISVSGACLQLSNPPRPGTTALLKWKSHDIFCDVAWATNNACGLKFETRLSRSVICETTGQVSQSSGISADPSNIPLGMKRTRTRVAH